MSAKWGIPAAILVATAGCFLPAHHPPAASPAGAAQPSIPSPPPGAPSIDFTVPPRPSGGTGMLEPTRPATPSADRPRPLLPQSINVALKVERDGRLTVAETVFVQARKSMTRRVPLRIRSGDDRDRVFTVRDAKVDGNGSTELTGDEFIIRLGEGATTVTYTVDGTVIDLGDRQEARWQVAGGWDVEVRFLRASFIAPDSPGSVVCLAGALGSTSPCESALTDHGQVLRVVQQNLKPGNRIDLSVGLPAGTVPANARFDSASTSASAFALTPLSGAGFALLTLLVLAGFALLWLARGRDAKALATDVGPVDVLMRDGDRVSFASPDGVLPGQIGTVVDERVDPVDVTATVIDLAVRNYLWITETPGDKPGWELVRRNPPDDALTAYERAVLAAVLPDGVDRVGVSTLCPDLAPARNALYADVVARDWFTRRPDHERTRWMLAGAVLVLAGIAATVVLALTVGHALLGLALVIGGVALTLGARWMPARTRRGSVLVQQIRGLLGYLRGADPAAIPDAADRDLVLSRSLPYAIALGDLDHWLTLLPDTLHWYEGSPGNLPGLLATLTARLT
ncbi:MAG TPA: DUF2207 domain-containing protein [Actinophytocola sp.]|uniref:DUF2207 domain-containing protein n=1 Tax=Actinophytocola sp. TaxID=1872138 RepID=UPI002DDD29AE|nr:DUF2207 domain-containing protein [Actinophytocola sp.]HEV2778146.1 DUF2207 domain-containing protein [Actinophytocola sp.]